jgi:hypothetical protein
LLRTLLAFAIVLFTSIGALAAGDDPQECAGFAPPYKNTCKFPITVYSKTVTGPLRLYQLAPGQSSPDERSPAERTGGVGTVVCHAGEKAFVWDGGAHGKTPWAGGDGGYECRKE